MPVVSCRHSGNHLIVRSFQPRITTTFSNYKAACQVELFTDAAKLMISKLPEVFSLSRKAKAAATSERDGISSSPCPNPKLRYHKVCLSLGNQACHQYQVAPQFVQSLAEHPEIGT